MKPCEKIPANHCIVIVQPADVVECMDSDSVVMFSFWPPHVIQKALELESNDLTFVRREDILTNVPSQPHQNKQRQANGTHEYMR